jgi:hypothetical protein
MKQPVAETEGQSDMSGTTAGGAPHGSRYADQRPYAGCGLNTCPIGDLLAETIRPPRGRDAPPRGN